MRPQTTPEKKVLIAEDDVVSRRLLDAFLSKWGYEAIGVSNGAEAWEVLEKEHSPRLAVLDWMMPGLDGIQICKRIRDRIDRPYVYVLLLSSKSQKRDMLEGLKAGADDYLSKPFDAEELKARLHVGQRIVQLQDDLIAAREALRFQATHDALTNLPNRAEVLSALRREEARCRRQGDPFGIIMADLDHFKNINDTYGHAAGDLVLQEAARRIAANVRGYDLAGRYGGEEFIVVAPLSDESGIIALAERIRAVMERDAITVGESKIHISVSIGAAISTHDRPLDTEALLRIADAALYRAKDRGRNCVEMASPQLVEAMPVRGQTQS